MNDFTTACAAELRHLRANRFDLALVTWLPMLFLMVMGGMLFAGNPERLGVVIVDHDHSAASRAVIRAVESTPQLAIAGQVDTLDTALARLRREEAVAILILPEGLGTLRPQVVSPKVEILYQAAFLSTGTLAANGLRASVATALARRLPRDAGISGIALLRIPLPGVQVTILGNPGLSFEWYLGLLIGPAILHLSIAVATVASLGREIEQGTLAGWASRYRSPAAALAGRFVPYVVLGTVEGVLWLLWLTLARGYRFEGQIALVVVGMVLLFCATSAMSAMLVTATGNVATSLSASVIYGGSALAYSGASLPLNGGAALPRFWSGMLPLTHDLNLQMDQAIGASTMAFVLNAAILLLYVPIAGGIAVLLLRRAARRA